MIYVREDPLNRIEAQLKSKAHIANLDKRRKYIFFQDIYELSSQINQPTNNRPLVLTRLQI
jgi:hypothetical protein